MAAIALKLLAKATDSFQQILTYFLTRTKLKKATIHLNN